MDALSEEHGQALVIAALLLGIAAVVIAGLRLSQDVIFAKARASRAGEAAVEAATAVVADAYVAELRRAADAATSPDVNAALSRPQVHEDAQRAASDLSTRNGGDAIADVTISCDAGAVEVSLAIAGATFRAGFRADACFRR